MADKAPNELKPENGMFWKRDIMIPGLAAIIFIIIIIT